MPSVTLKTKFFEFVQNNSGGRFHTDAEAGIGPRVWVEAVDAADANRRAEEIGIYFDGVSDGRDCGCCGDRWYEIWDRNEGKEFVSPNDEYDFNWHDAVYVHHIDGRIELLKKPTA